MKVEAIVKDKIVELCLLDGKETINCDAYGGHCRQVFYCNGYFIKFDNPTRKPIVDDCGIQTQLELEKLFDIEEVDKGYFCLPVALGEIGGLWYTVQEEVKDEAEPTNEDIDQLDAILEKYGLGDVGWGTNCAFTENGWKIYDYAQ